jgi:hypothetical protein
MSVRGSSGLFHQNHALFPTSIEHR